MGIFGGDRPCGVRGDSVDGLSARIVCCFCGDGCSGGLADDARQALPLVVGVRNLLDFVVGLGVVLSELCEELRSSMVE